MSQFFLKTETPTVEITVTAVDAGGHADSCVIGFKRPTSPEASEQLRKDWNALFADMGEDVLITEAPEVSDFLTSRIAYIKNYHLVDEAGKPGPAITDTRIMNDQKFFNQVFGVEDNSAKAEALEEGTLAWLLQQFLSSQPWWSAIVAGLIKTFSNSDFGEAERKN